MKKSVFHKLLVVLGILLSLALLVCSCGGETPDPENPEEPENPGDPTVTYTVTVTNESNAPIEGATVELFSGSTAKGTATTNASGVATFEVAEGVYTSVKVSKEGYVAKESMIPSGSQSVTVALTVDPTVTYTVTVVRWPDEPIAGATVQLCVGDICRLPVVTDANGVATLKLEKDDYTVKVFKDGYEIEPYYTFEEGSTELTIYLLPTKGSEGNPYFFDEAENNQLTVGAGETVYFLFRAEGATMNLLGTDVSVLHNEATYTAEDGMVTITECYSDSYSPSLFAVTNNGSAEATYTVNFLYPVGYMQNPAELTIGSNSVTTKENYYYSYTATAAGDLTIAMDAACTDWSYTVNVYPAGHDESDTDSITPTYGSINSSTDDPCTASHTVTVAAGDTVEIIIAAAGMDAATITFTATFEAAN